MEKRALLAIVLALAVLVGWQWLFGPPPQAPREPPPAGAATAPATSSGQPAVPGQAGPAGDTPAQETGTDEGPAPPPAGLLEEEAERALEIETSLSRIALTNRGGRIVSWTLKKYADDAGKPYQLVSPAGEKAAAPTYPLDVQTDEQATDKALAGALFVASMEPAAGGERVTLKWSDGKGLEAEKTLLFHKEGYFCDVAVSVRNRGRSVPAWVVWGPGIGGALLKQRTSTFDHVGRGVLGSAGIVERIAPASLKTTQTISPAGAGGIGWAGVEEQYFASFFLPGEGKPGLDSVRFQPFDVLPAPGEKIERHVAVGVLASGPVRLYAGPKEYSRLKEIGAGTSALVYFSQPLPIIGGILSPVIHYLALGIYLSLVWLYGLIPNWGVAIILVTVGLKIVFYPLTQRSFVKMRRVQQQMQTVQPKVKAIKERYRKLKGAEARQKMNQEMMELYRKEGINPLGGMTGCLPLLIQLPFLYAVYNVLIVSIELRKAPFFGWIQDLATRDPYYVTPVLMGITMFIQQKMAMTRITDPQQRAQQRMMLFMPVMFMVFFINLPSGLNLYWFVSNLLQIGQQALINRQADRLLAAETGGGHQKGRSRRGVKMGEGQAGGEADA